MTQLRANTPALAVQVPAISYTTSKAALSANTSITSHRVYCRLPDDASRYPQIFRWIMTHRVPAPGASTDSEQVSNEGVGQQVQGGSETTPAVRAERRARIERRRHSLSSVWYGSWRARRRAPPRRVDDLRFQVIDWYSAHLLAVSIVILVACATDAFLTINLLMGGAVEVNPVMNALIYRSAAVFTSVKMALTGTSVLLMVFLARYRFMQRVRVELVLYGVLAGYLALIGYEFWLLSSNGDTPLL